MTALNSSSNGHVTHHTYPSSSLARTAASVSRMETFSDAIKTKKEEVLNANFEQVIQDLKAHLVDSNVDVSPYLDALVCSEFSFETKRQVAVVVRKMAMGLLSDAHVDPNLAVYDSFETWLTQIMAKR